MVFQAHYLALTNDRAKVLEQNKILIYLLIQFTIIFLRFFQYILLYAYTNDELPLDVSSSVPDKRRVGAVVVGLVDHLPLLHGVVMTLARSKENINIFCAIISVANFTVTLLG